jgi:hypothetical protein
MKKIIAILGLSLLSAPLAAEGQASGLNTALWLALAKHAAPSRNAIREPYRYTGGIRYTDKPELMYRFYTSKGSEQITGFTLTNNGSPHINPRGAGHSGASRTYDFLFADRAREDIHLMVSDDVNLSGRYSHDNMFRELHFFPRNQLPSIAKTADGKRLKVELPTGEVVFFDAWSKEIVSGVLSEAPIDFTRDRHKRHNPDVEYHGRNLVISVAQRGEAPRRAVVWGKTKFAEVRYPAKYQRACRLSPRLIWDQKPKPGDNDPKLTMLFPTDAALFDTIEQHCGWDLGDLRLAAAKAASKVAKVDSGHAASATH